MNEHNCHDYSNGYFIGNAIKKYGKIDEFEILEEISPDNREKMNEREIYWIKYFKSNNPEYGYNLEAGGNSHDRYGWDVGTAKLNEEQYY